MDGGALFFYRGFGAFFGFQQALCGAQGVCQAIRRKCLLGQLLGKFGFAQRAVFGGQFGLQCFVDFGGNKAIAVFIDGGAAFVFFA